MTGRASVPEKRHSIGDRARRVRAVEEAGELIGKARLAAMLDLPERTLRSYASVERGLPAGLLTDAAAALEARGAEILAHAAKLRDLAGDAS